MTPSNITHDKLCKKALSFLYNEIKCRFALSEVVCVGEIPDAIGWYYGSSILIECKTSRADFLADRKKYFKGRESLGRYRFYLSPPDIIMPEDLPEKWGLLYLVGNSVKKIVFPTHHFGCESWNNFEHEVSEKQELTLLSSTARRLRDNCPRIINKIYTDETLKTIEKMEK